MKYFCISSGLRGCYLDDNGFVAAFTTRRALKACLIEECERSRDAYGYGGSKVEIAAVAAWAWKQTKCTMPMAIAFGDRGTSYRPFGVFVSKATRGEYKSYVKEND